MIMEASDRIISGKIGNSNVVLIYCVSILDFIFLLLFILNLSNLFPCGVFFMIYIFFVYDGSDKT